MRFCLGEKRDTPSITHKCAMNEHIRIRRATYLERVNAYDPDSGGENCACGCGGVSNDCVDESYAAKSYYSIWQLELDSHLQLIEISFCPFCGENLEPVS